MNSNQSSTKIHFLTMGEMVFLEPTPQEDYWSAFFYYIAKLFLHIGLDLAST
jgi:hypothetical protein